MDKIDTTNELNLNLENDMFSKNKHSYIGNIYPDNYKIDLSNTIMEMSNIYPKNLTKHTIYKKDYKIVRQIQSSAYGLCRTKIPMEYIKYSFKKFENGFVYYDYNQLIAFCIWTVDMISMTNTQLHILLICGKKRDYNLVPRILDDVVYLCRKSNIQYISLIPANEELQNYYIQCGFEKNSMRIGDDMYVLDVSKSRIIPHTTPDTIVRKRINKTRKYRK
jgi:hypothetical protein